MYRTYYLSDHDPLNHLTFFSSTVYWPDNVPRTSPKPTGPMSYIMMTIIFNLKITLRKKSCFRWWFQSQQENNRACCQFRSTLRENVPATTYQEVLKRYTGDGKKTSCSDSSECELDHDESSSTTDMFINSFFGSISVCPYWWSTPRPAKTAHYALDYGRRCYGRPTYSD